MYRETSGAEIFRAEYNPAFVRAIRERRKKAEQAEKHRVAELSEEQRIELLGEQAVRSAAERVRRNAAELAELHAMLSRQEEDLLELTAQADLLQRQEKRRGRERLRRIEALAMRVFGVTLTELHGDGKKHRIAFPKHFVRYWASRSGMSALEMGRCMGGKDHSSIIHSIVAYPKMRAKMGRTLRALERRGYKTA